ncbi:unnamed protein product [Closterium sp. NIES-65]|nr:unnamed protein product [Closterium sp. NIES-65]
MSRINGDEIGDGFPEVYGGEKRIAPLRRLFPWLEDKTSLATEEELQPFLGKASLLAALDFYVSRYSDVFVSASLGNMHNVMAAHRAYFGGLKTINFNGTLLATLLAAPPNTLNWNEFVRAVQIGHRSRMGKIKPRRAGQSIYTYPAPDCLCPIDVPPSQPATRTVTRYKKAAEGRRRLRLLTTLQSLYSFLRVLIAASLMARPLITARLHGSTGGGPQALQIDVKESLAAALGAAAALTGNLASGTSRARVLKLYASLSLMACVAALLPLLTGPLVYPEKWMTVRKNGSSNSAEGADNLEQLWTAVATASIAIDMAGLLDDCPLPVGEVSSSVLAATCQRRDPISDHFKPDDAHGSVSEASETEKGLLMLVTADFPGLQVCNSEGVWSPADQGVPPGSLLLLAGRCLHRATAGLCPASTYRVLPPASAGATR